MIVILSDDGVDTMGKRGNLLGNANASAYLADATVINFGHAKGNVGFDGACENAILFQY